MNESQVLNTETKITLEVPFDYAYEEHDGKEYHMIFSNDETKKLLPVPVVVQAHTKDEAIRKVWTIVKMHINYLDKRSRVADRWQPFATYSDKNRIQWFRIFGFMFYFRRGKGMKGGWYIPFTNLNIRIINHHRLYKRLKNERNTKKD